MIIKIGKKKKILLPVSLVVMIHCFWTKINYLEIPLTNQKTLKFISNKFQHYLSTRKFGTEC